MKKRADLVDEWFKKAESDFKNISLVMVDSDPPTDTVCFHAQQAAEKYLKGFLFFHQIRFPKIHDIESLVELCNQVAPDFNELIELAADLSAYSVEIRYPDNFITPSLDEAKEAIGNAQKIKQKVLEKMKGGANRVTS